MANPITIVSSNFLAPNPVVLFIFTAIGTLSVFSNTPETFMTVNNVNGTDRPIMFQIQRDPMSLHDHLILADAAGYPILSLQKQLMSSHNKRWVVQLSGGSSDSNDIIFSAKRSSLIQQKTSIDVFLARNKTENACVFKVKASTKQSDDDSCTIYAGNDATIIIAQMQRVGALLGTYNVTVYPNVDQAFISTLVVILHEINNDVHDDQQLQFTGSARKQQWACSYAWSFVSLHLLLYFIHKW